MHAFLFFLLLLGELVLVLICSLLVVLAYYVAGMIHFLFFTDTASYQLAHHVHVLSTELLSNSILSIRHEA